MSDQFMGETRIFSFAFAPKTWAQCNGQLLPINQNQALFSLLGVMYGGDGQTTFALPDLRGRASVHVGAGIVQGQKAGEQQHTLLTAEMPQHIHLMNANASVDAASNSNTPAASNTLGQSIGSNSTGTFPVNIYNSTLSTPTALAPGMVGNNGSSQPHENRQPFTVLNVCIALQGIFPSRN